MVSCPLFWFIQETDVVLDALDNSQLKIGIEMSLFGISCQYASVDLRDAVGRTRLNITQDMNKFTIDHRTGKIAQQVDSLPPAPEYGDVDHDPNNRHSTDLDEKSFESFVTGNDISLVNFYAPWCHWCQKLVSQFSPDSIPPSPREQILRNQTQKI